MGVIGKKLASRLRRAKKLVGDLRRQAAADFATVSKDVKNVETLLRSVQDPLHAAYVAALNFTTFFMGEVTQFPEFDSYWDIYGPAQKEYFPQGPPMSPLTTSFFTSWAVFDLRFGPDQETIGTCLLDVADPLERWTLSWSRRFASFRIPAWASTSILGSKMAAVACGNW